MPCTSDTSTTCAVLIMGDVAKAVVTGVVVLEDDILDEGVEGEDDSDGSGL